MSTDEEIQRSTLPELERTTADRAYSVDNDLIMAGITAARRQFGEYIGGSDLTDTGVQGAEMPGTTLNGTPMKNAEPPDVDPQMTGKQAPKGSHTEEDITLMNAQKILSDFNSNSFTDWAGSNGIEMLNNMWSSQTKAWGELKKRIQ
ncbi:MAG: hypothetical protein QGG02_16035 [Gammaproteobacteria bacterium]|jgi:hypothetical protein|nr:hypothetical protein [Gammaproteobacteria bacterium]MDP6732989.1 hypothetical protein [Gammaproteobacteria bacterium]|tara:strand:- start:1456 stop:1896 length:441 start_codon:yes stop_codon:yes gene_type:complete